MSGYHGWMAASGAFDPIIDGVEEMFRLAKQQISNTLRARRETRAFQEDAEARRMEERAEELGACLVEGLFDERGGELVEWLYVNVPYVPADDYTIYLTEAPYHLCSRCDTQTFENVEPEAFALTWSYADLSSDTQEELTREVIEDLLNDLLPDIVYAMPERFE